MHKDLITFYGDEVFHNQWTQKTEKRRVKPDASYKMKLNV